MPIKPNLKRVMVIGSGPIVIGQAAEFDYAGTQACRALKEEGLEVILVNSNPATIMTDNAMADKVYIEPLTLPVVKRIIEKEKPDGLISTLGGQTGLTLSMQLAKEGFLEKNGVQLLGANPETIDKAEDRQMFKDTMEAIGQPVIPSLVVNDVESAVDFANEIGYPVIIRPAFTLGGTGGGIVDNEEELREITSNGLELSPITQVLVEKCIAGWKEIEFEVIRDSDGNVITVCSMENFDPVGVHTGDSIVIAPAVTLADKEYQMLRSASLNIIQALGVEGGCNCQFALNPESFEYAVIEVNPRVSRSSALASKATGYPIAKVAAKIAIGYTLGEIKNAVTGSTYACFEPALDYVVVKFPKWPFDKFVYAKRTLGTQMKATGEVMAIAPTFEHAIMKAVRGAEISHDTLDDKKFAKMSDENVVDRLSVCDDQRIFCVFEALKRGVSVDKIHEITLIDEWFLNKLLILVDMEKTLKEGNLDEATYFKAKKLGFLDRTIEAFTGEECKYSATPVYKMVDTCAAEFDAETPYFYSTFDEENEAEEFIKEKGSDKETVMVFGSGPIRIGQGIEFDYSSVHCVWSLKKAGYDVVIVNNNPETVSTDFDTADRLYFEPLTNEDVMGIIKTEKPIGAVVAFGGQTAIKLTKYLSDHGIRILGTSADAIDMAEDRERFDELLEEHHISRPKGFTVMNCEEALETAEKIGYPVLLRPSYVLGGQNMIIAFNEADVKEYMAIILAQNIENPVLIDKYMMGTELEVDAICDGDDILIPGIMEHVERAGVHSGDSIAVYPAWNISDEMTETIVNASRNLALSLQTKGLVNIQYLIYNGELNVIEVNPRSSRTIPYISKVTGVPMVDLATRAMFGEKLKDMGYGTGLYKKSPYVAVKVPVFSFEKLINVDNHLGPEMKSTGEVLGIASTLEEALYKGLIGAGYKMKRGGGVFITVRNSDKCEIGDVAKKYADLGFKIYATEGTANYLHEYGINAITVKKIHEDNRDNTLTLIESGKIQYVISTSAKGRQPERDSVKIRRKTVERNIPCLTSIDTANALADCLKSKYSQISTELVDINDMRDEKMKLNFTKMHGTGNDYIYFSTFDQRIDNPEALSVRLSDRHFGIGGDGIILVCPSDKADAKMRIFNLDGSEGKMCGNGIRCVGKFLYDHGMVDIKKKDKLDIETLSGIKHLKAYTLDGEVKSLRVDMGKAILDPKEIPAKMDKDKIVNEPYTIDGEEYNITCVSMGNPHCVVFIKGDIDNLELDEIGPKFENDKLFPERVNTEFVKVLDDHTIKMRVWERGSGETWACGTGACAAAVAACENGFCNKGDDITVKLKGGDLVINYTDETVYMTGEAEKVFEGTVEV
ncbi:MAG: carbamoyl-phosphate synthase large subunit [Ruminococcus sp.]|nr:MULTISPECIES: carbamoyl-phosphate synthase large subunit [Ruminococcus]MCI5599228.1 carbamoyl-phosphate synthase large subunit [Ruminococcus sp.]MCI5616965.1 carbamoyl-phosphate synthase large subunit [Ruminococcus sp.]MDD5890200.1 carbamoyl-phosphate synthase large subunit [Ruminococcus sp.]MDY3662693.1 carbamoyl-phosphate synthase large subunit [Ruminococcus bovis]